MSNYDFILHDLDCSAGGVELVAREQYTGADVSGADANLYIDLSTVNNMFKFSVGSVDSMTNIENGNPDDAEVTLYANGGLEYWGASDSAGAMKNGGPVTAQTNLAHGVGMVDSIENAFLVNNIIDVMYPNFSSHGTVAAAKGLLTKTSLEAYHTTVTQQSTAIDLKWQSEMTRDASSEAQGGFKLKDLSGVLVSERSIVEQLFRTMCLEKLRDRFYEPSGGANWHGDNSQGPVIKPLPFQVGDNFVCQFTMHKSNAQQRPVNPGGAEEDGDDFYDKDYRIRIRICANGTAQSTAATDSTTSTIDLPDPNPDVA
jgi:hypothetical protein